MAGDKSLKEKALEKLGTNPTQIGDPTSVKAETSDKNPTPEEGGAAKKDHKSLKDLAKENPTMLGDPVSLKAEKSDSEPTDEDRGASKTKRQSKL